MPDDTLCPYEAGCNQARTQHSHPYRVGIWGGKRCTCGNRTWKITVGGRREPLVSCARCGNRGYSATAYEAGRAEGPRKVTVHASTPDF